MKSVLMDSTSDIRIELSTDTVKVEGITHEVDPTVPSWSKTPNKPTYTAEEVGALPKDTRIPTKLSELVNDVGYIVNETDPTVAEWAKAPEKPTYTAEEIGAMPDSVVIPTRVSDLENDQGYITDEVDPTVPNWAKESEKPTYTAEEVGALPENTFIPNKTSDLENDSGFITDYIESDPTVPNWAKQTDKPEYSLSEIVGLSDALATKTTEAYVDEKFNEAITAGIDYSVVDELPSEGQKGIIYLIANGGAGDNSYDEYIWVTDKYEMIGSTVVDLSPYIKKSEIEGITTDDIEAMWEGVYYE